MTDDPQLPLPFGPPPEEPMEAAATPAAVNTATHLVETLTSIVIAATTTDPTLATESAKVDLETKKFELQKKKDDHGHERVRRNVFLVVAVAFVVAFLRFFFIAENSWAVNTGTTLVTVVLACLVLLRGVIFEAFKTKMEPKFGELLQAILKVRDKGEK